MPVSNWAEYLIEALSALSFVEIYSLIFWHATRKQHIGKGKNIEACKHQTFSASDETDYTLRNLIKCLRTTRSLCISVIQSYHSALRKKYYSPAKIRYAVHLDLLFWLPEPIKTILGEKLIVHWSSYSTTKKESLSLYSLIKAASLLSKW